jgi:hypothetical protein
MMDGSELRKERYGSYGANLNGRSKIGHTANTRPNVIRLIITQSLIPKRFAFFLRNGTGQRFSASKSRLKLCRSTVDFSRILTYPRAGSKINIFGHA